MSSVKRVLRVTVISRVISLLWLLLQEIDYHGLQHALSAQGEKVSLKKPADGFHSQSKTVFQYHGCYFHGRKSCYKDRAAKNSVNRETFDALYTETVQRTQQLRNAGHRGCNLSFRKTKQ